MKIFKFLQVLGGFGNLRFAEIKSCPRFRTVFEKIEVRKRDDPPIHFMKLFFRKIEFFFKGDFPNKFLLPPY